MGEILHSKRCSKCKEIKSVVDFHKDNGQLSGLSPRCRQCKSKRVVPIIDRSKITDKKCSECREIKSISNFHASNKSKLIYQPKCKVCMANYKKAKYWSNRDVELAKMTKSRLKPENVLQRKEYYIKNKEGYQKRHHKLMSDEEKRKQRREKSNKYGRENANKISEKRKLHNQKEEVKERRRLHHHKRKSTDIQYVIKRRLRCRLRHVVKYLGGNKFKLKSAIELLGCDMVFFKKHIESKFTDGMSWDNYGRKGWHIDHKKPCAEFDLRIPEEQSKCFNYGNLQPLWWYDNLKKGATYQELKIE